MTLHGGRSNNDVILYQLQHKGISPVTNQLIHDKVLFMIVFVFHVLFLNMYHLTWIMGFVLQWIHSLSEIFYFNLSKFQQLMIYAAFFRDTDSIMWNLWSNIFSSVTLAIIKQSTNFQLFPNMIYVYIISLFQANCQLFDANILRTFFLRIVRI